MDAPPTLTTEGDYQSCDLRDRLVLLAAAWLLLAGKRGEVRGTAGETGETGETGPWQVLVLSR